MPFTCFEISPSKLDSFIQGYIFEDVIRVDLFVQSLDCNGA